MSARVHLCMCHHWDHQHYGAVMTCPCAVPGCKCDDYFEIARGSSHRYQPSQSVMPKQTRRLVTGDRILCRMIDKQLVPSATKRNALVLTVESLQYVSPNVWAIVTELGTTIGVLASSRVLSVNKT